MQGKDHKVVATQEEYCFHNYSNKLHGCNGYAFFERNYRPNPDFENIHPGISYTFLGDMLCYFPWYSGEELLNKLKKYEKDMLKEFCKGNPKAFEIMIYSLNELGWIVYSDVNGEKDIISKWAFDEYNRLMYDVWKKYVSEEEMVSIRINLD